MSEREIILKNVRVHNLKNVDITLPTQKLIVFTGVSGSGKSSLAFDTIYIEGQRRYIESLSTFARRHLGDMAKPEADLITGISPTIAIEQKTAGRNPRSTVGTMTGIHDYLRVLYARVGTAYCPISHEPVKPQSTVHILNKIKGQKSAKILILSPYVKNKKGEFKDDFQEILRKGFTRIRLDGNLVEITSDITVDKNVSHTIDLVIDRLVVSEENYDRLAESIEMALDLGKGLVIILNSDTSEETLFSKHAYSAKSGMSYPPLEPHDFSFNHPSGMCPTCQGLGVTSEFDLNKIIDPEKSIEEDCCAIGSSYQTVRYGNIYNNLARLYGFKVNTPWKNLSEKAKKVFLYGVEAKWTKMNFVHPQKNMKWTEYVEWKGVIHEARQRLASAQSDFYRNRMKELMSETTCPECKGERIKPYPAATRLGEKRIAEVSSLSIEEALAFFKSLFLTSDEQHIAAELLKEIVQRLYFLQDVGLHYLTLDRTAPTLSGGEAQRVRLASQIGSGLVGATYVLDEPSIGLHPRDNAKLIQTLQTLRDKGNTVIVVEHDEETIYAADHIVDVGPEAGWKGGEVIVEGSLSDLLKEKRSITGAYLSGRKKIPVPEKRRKIGKQAISIKKATHHNLKKLSVDIPLGGFVAVTGVSGSGKSSLITDILYPALSNKLQRSELPVGKHESMSGIEFLDKVIAIDQTPIGRTPRSNPATYIKLFDDIRDLFCSLPASIAKGFKAGRFSFNVKEGSCPMCSGMGMVKIDMDFLEDIWVTCDTCKGKRFDQNTLSVTYKEKNIHDILEMSIAEALVFFDALPKIKEKLLVLQKVGLDYMKIGQPSPTLSGGEAQRIKLAKELVRPSTGKTLYILDEPTTGLHFYDIDKLCKILHDLVDLGNTVLVIEHNMDLVKTADWVIDLGPEGGNGGGQVIAEGTPEEIVKKKTPTGIALKNLLKGIPETPSHFEQEHKAPFNKIIVTGASQNNLKNVSASIPREKITICTGPSGSGKTSFAFDTIYAEGQRRYIESMSSYARQFVEQMPKPKIETIDGLSPAIAIEQKNHAGNPRSTVGTMTEIYDFLRILYAHLGTAYDPETNEKLTSITKEYVLDQLLTYPEGTKLHILAPAPLQKGESFTDWKERFQKQGFLRVRCNKTYYELDEEIPFDPKRKNELQVVIDRIILSPKIKNRLFEAIEKTVLISGGTLYIDKEGEELYYNLAFAAPSTGKSYPPITPHTFSFNTPQGMCPDCLGLGFQHGVGGQLQEQILKHTPLALIKKLWKESLTQESVRLFLIFLDQEKISSTEAIHKLPSEKLQILLFGSKKEISHPDGFTFSWNGIHPAFTKLTKTSAYEVKESLIPQMEESPCLSCKGSRLNPLARHVRIDDTTITNFCQFPIQDAYVFVSKLQKNIPEFLEETIVQLKHRLGFLQEVGLHYLSLDRSAPSLSGGETQRIRLSKQIGSGLTGCLYVLDEPTIGLHPHNTALLHKSLKHLTNLGNTLILVEHDPMTIAMADYLLDFGPGAGKSGGRITAQGTYQEIMKNPDSLTGAYLSGKKQIPIPKKRRFSDASIEIKNAKINNLKNFTTKIPIKTFTCITGVSGSGKSTLMNDLLFPAAQKALQARKDQIEIQGSTVSGLGNFDKLIVIDQNPIGHTVRADISTYTDLLTPLRHFFASLSTAKMRGLQSKNFSYNHRKGMCTTCFGLGYKNIEMQFLPPVTITCESCQGYRLNPLSLQVTYKDKHLGQILQMTAVEARQFLEALPKPVKILDTLISVGLGYVRLDQEIATLSGGEAQRIRLSRELAKRSTGRTLYLFDEPTIGLHSDDIAKLLPIFQRLVEKGNTLVMIEHHLDLVANADFLIDLGPEAGDEGGKIIATGTPEEVAKHKTSYTGKYLAEHLASVK